MQKYKKGDRVLKYGYEYIVQCWSEEKQNGVMELVDGSNSVFDDCNICGLSNHTHGLYMKDCLSRITLISSAKKVMENLITLSKTQKLAFTKEQQALFRVGLTDSYCSINQEAAIEALVRLNYKALVTQAEADIKEIEELEEKETKKGK